MPDRVLHPTNHVTVLANSKSMCRGRNGSLPRSLSSTLPPQVPPPVADDEMKPPIPNVRLGPLLGKGSFGSVHYGTWNGAQIAVKVFVPHYHDLSF